MDDLGVDEAEQWVRRKADEITRPEDGECLACFVARMLTAFGCDNTLRFAQRYRDLRAPLATALERRVGSMGGFCDCEIFLNGLRLADDACVLDEYGDLVAPEERPACRQVGRGSVRSCAVWVRQRGH